MADLSTNIGEFGIPAFVSSVLTLTLNFYFKRKLDKAAKRYEITFSRFHEKRAAAIEEIYSSLYFALQSLMAYLASPGPSTGVMRQDKLESFGKKFSDFQNSYSQKRIYLSIALCNQLEKIDQKIFVEFQSIRFSQYEDETFEQQRIDSFKNIRDLINVTLREIEVQWTCFGKVESSLL